MKKIITLISLSLFSCVESNVEFPDDYRLIVSKITTQSRTSSEYIISALNEKDCPYYKIKIIDTVGKFTVGERVYFKK